MGVFLWRRKFIGFVYYCLSVVDRLLRRVNMRFIIIIFIITFVGMKIGAASYERIVAMDSDYLVTFV